MRKSADNVMLIAITDTRYSGIHHTRRWHSLSEVILQMISLFKMGRSLVDMRASIAVGASGRWSTWDRQTVSSLTTGKSQLQRRSAKVTRYASVRRDLFYGR